MRPGRVALAATLALASLPHRGPAQTEVELRAATGEYRFVDLSHTFGGGLVLDAVYVGWPGLNEAHLGAGYLIEPASGLSAIPLLYAVVGNGVRGVTIGGYIDVSRGGWRIAGFAGRFFQTGGTVADYTYVDALDVTRVIRRWEVGGSADFSASEGDRAWLVGPTLKWHDGVGAWAVAVRFGPDREFRLVRTFAF